MRNETIYQKNMILLKKVKCSLFPIMKKSFILNYFHQSITFQNINFI